MVLKFKEKQYLFRSVLILVVGAVVLVPFGVNKEPAEAHPDNAPHSSPIPTGAEGKLTVGTWRCYGMPIPANSHLYACVATGTRGMHVNFWNTSTGPLETDCHLPYGVHYRPVGIAQLDNCGHKEEDGKRFVRHENKQGTHVLHPQWKCNEGYRFVAFGNPPCVPDGATTTDVPDTDDTTRDTGTSDDTSDTGDPPPSKDPVTPTPDDPPPPTCDANEELVNGVCVPVCVHNHDHGRTPPVVAVNRS